MAAYLETNAVAAVRITSSLGIDTALVTDALTAWFSSPYWLDSPTLGALLDRGSADEDPSTGLVGGAAEHVLRESALSRMISQSAMPRSARAEEAIPPLSLVDQYLLGTHGSLTLAHYGAVASALSADSPAAVRIVLRSGEQVSTSISSLLAWLVSETIRAGFGNHVTNGLSTYLARFDARNGNTPQADLLCLLPIHGGLLKRSSLLSAEGVAIPLSLYPLLATLMPEVSPHITPTVDDLVGAMLCSQPVPRTGRIIPLTRVQRQQHHVRRATTGMRRKILATASARTVHGIHRLKTALRSTPAMNLLNRMGIGYDTSRGWVRRLRVDHATNPLLTRQSKRTLDEARRFDQSSIAA